MTIKQTTIRSQARLRATRPATSKPPVDSAGDIEALLHFTAQPGYLIRRVHQVAVAMFTHDMAHLDLTPVQYAAMVTIRSYPGIDQQAAGSRIGVDRTTMNDVAKRLAAKGLVLRVAGRGRQFKLTLTDAGTNLVLQAGRTVQKHGDELLLPLTERQRRDFIESLLTLVHAHTQRESS